MANRRVLITGGAGFIGCNLADALIADGQDVVLFDSLSRPGTDNNLAWLRQRFAKSFQFIQGDIRDYSALHAAMEGMAAVYHLAGQTAVTRSVVNPRDDFEINALGTLNVLEAARSLKEVPILLFSSTNKVYGALEGARVDENETRYLLPDLPQGIDEQWPVDFHSPYGCSKGAADQYVHDYARIYGLPTIVFRQSCVYGERQFGIEDQGWVAWFVIAAVTGYPITIYGNGKQVRDLLHISDLVRAYRTAVAQIDKTAGQIYNVGGGAGNTISIWAEFGPLLRELLQTEIRPARFENVRPGDQPVFVSNTSKTHRDFGWHPTTSIRDGVVELLNWVRANEHHIKAVLAR